MIRFLYHDVKSESGVIEMIYVVEQGQSLDWQRVFTEQAPATLYSSGVIVGKYPGRVLVDNPTQPRSAFIQKGSWVQLAGAATNEAFVDALRAELIEKQILGEDTGALFFVGLSEAWLAVLNSAVPGRELIPFPRQIYKVLGDYSSEVGVLPAGYILHPITEQLTEQIDELPSDVKKVIELRQQAENPDEVAFGFVIKHKQTCVAWAVIDFIWQTMGEIRLFTDSDHRRQGLAMAICSATFTYAQQAGLTEIIWDVAEANHPSMRLAEKLGLTYSHRGMEYILIYSEVSYLVNRAFSFLDTGRFEKTLANAEPMLTSDEALLVQFGHFLCGAAFTGLGEDEKAFEQLHLAIDNGFTGRREFGHPVLSRLHDKPEWQRILDRATEA